MSKRIDQYELSGEYVGSFDSCLLASKAVGVCRTSVSNNVHGRSKSSAGFIFRSSFDEICGEVWRDHPTMDISCSTFGRIQQPNGSRTYGAKGSHGYFMVSCEGRSGKVHLVHRLIAETFCLETRHQGDYVDHIDGTRTNNRPENLEWVTQKENLKRYWRNSKPTDV